jgi:hypothetical protein
MKKFLISLIGVSAMLVIVSLLYGHVAQASDVCLRFNSSWYNTNLRSDVLFDAGTKKITIPNNPNTVSILNPMPFIGGCENYDGFLFFYTPLYIDIGTERLLISSADIKYLSGTGLVGAVAPFLNTYKSQIRDNIEKIIDYISVNNKIDFVTSSFSAYGNRSVQYAEKKVSIPATNCVKLAGDGPIKVIFAREKNSALTVEQFLKIVPYYIEGFHQYDPYRTYISNFSFYLDLKKYDFINPMTMVGVSTDNINGLADGFLAKNISLYNNSIADHYSSKVITKPSCGGGDSVNQNNNIIYISWPYALEDKSSYAYKSNNLSWINGGNIDRFGLSLPLTIIHEFTHSFAGLSDEYVYTDNSDITSVNRGTLIDAGTLRNCSLKPSSDFRSNIDNKIYGATNIEGCTFFASRDVTHPVKYYRPSQKSIMNTGVDRKYLSPYFNVISCGYIVAAIKGEYTTKENAQKYWPECSKMATIDKGDMPPAGRLPTVSSVTPDTTQLDTFIIKGTNFSATDNTVKLIPVSTGALNSRFNLMASVNQIFNLFNNRRQEVAVSAITSKSYEIEGVSSDGTTLNVKIPSSVPNGTYKISVGAFNSPWKDTNLTIVVNHSVVPNPVNPETPVTPEPPVATPKPDDLSISTYKLDVTINDPSKGYVVINSPVSSECRTIRCQINIPKDQLVEVILYLNDNNAKISTSFDGLKISRCLIGSEHKCSFTLKSDGRLGIFLKNPVPTIENPPTVNDVDNSASCAIENIEPSKELANIGTTLGTGEYLEFITSGIYGRSFLGKKDLNGNDTYLPVDQKNMYHLDYYNKIFVYLKSVDTGKEYNIGLLSKIDTVKRSRTDPTDVKDLSKIQIPKIVPNGNYNVYFKWILSPQVGGNKECVDKSNSVISIVNPPLGFKVVSDVKTTKAKLLWVNSNPEFKGYVIYRDNVLIHTITDPAIVTYIDDSMTELSHKYKIAGIMPDGRYSGQSKEILFTRPAIKR